MVHRVLGKYLNFLKIYPWFVEIYEKSPRFITTNPRSLHFNYKYPKVLGN
jgi:hypothetical protein